MSGICLTGAPHPHRPSPRAATPRRPPFARHALTSAAVARALPGLALPLSPPCARALSRYAIRGGAVEHPPGSTPRASEQVLELGDLEPDDKLLCLKLAIKTADLSYLSKGHAYVQVWTDRVLEEFFAQVTCRAIVDQPRAARAWQPVLGRPLRPPLHVATRAIGPPDAPPVRTGRRGGCAQLARLAGLLARRPLAAALADRLHQVHGEATVRVAR